MKMRLKNLTIGLALAASAWAPQASAGLGQGVPPNPNNFGPFKSLGVLGDGRRAFLEYNCSQCHGNAGTGGGRGANITPAATGGLTYDQVYNVIMRGEPYGGMPSFAAYVQPADIWNLYTYINNFGNQGQPTFLEWWVNKPKF
jgi:mono/diheme cytochrome c family protein